MIDFKVIATTKWISPIADQVPRSGRLSSLVFQIDCDYCLDLNYFIGLTVIEIETGYIVAGTVEDFERIETNRDTTFDIASFVSYVKQCIKDLNTNKEPEDEMRSEIPWEEI